MIIEFYLNDEEKYLEIPPETSLLDILSYHFELKYVRRGCERGHCGACTVLVDDHPTPACLLPAFNLPGRHVETLSGLIEREEFGHIETAFLRAGFYPCKYCAPTKIILAESILRRNENQPDENTILHYVGESWCSCTSQGSFVKAVQIADSLRRKRRALNANRR